jgi:hypothetical protein
MPDRLFESGVQTSHGAQALAGASPSRNPLSPDYRIRWRFINPRREEAQNSYCLQWVESGRWNIKFVHCVSAAMAKDKLYNEATQVTARDGEVILDGPDGVDVKVTPEAAEQTADNLIEEAVRARGQRRLLSLPHRSR